MKTILTLTALTLAVWMSACQAAPQLPPTPQAEPSPESTPLPQQGNDEQPVAVSILPAPGFEVTTYRDEHAGFSINLPAGWFAETSALAMAEQSVAYSVGFYSYDYTAVQQPTEKGQSGFPEGATKIEIAVWKEDKPLDEVMRGQGEGGGSILSQQAIVLPSGLEGIVYEGEGMAGRTRTLLTKVDGTLLFVTFYGNLDLFEVVAYSLGR